MERLWSPLMEKRRKLCTFSWIKVGLTPWMIDTYARMIKLWYVYLPKQRKQILSKLKRQVMRALNMREGDTQGQTEPVFDLERNSLKDVIDSDVDDGVSGRSNPLRLLKPSAPALRLERVIPFLSRLLGNGTRATSSKGNNSSTFPLGNSLPKLPPSIVPNDPSNPLLNSDNCRLWKTKKSAMLTFGGLNADSSYSAGQFADALSWDSPTVSENNIDDKNNSYQKLIQESLGFDKSQKSFMGLDFPYKKLKQESFCLSNSVQGDLILVDNWFSLLDGC